MLDALWETQDSLAPLLRCLPQEVWGGEGDIFVSQAMTSMSLPLNYLFQKYFNRVPTQADWTNVQKYSQRVTCFKIHPSEDNPAPQILFALQAQSSHKPLFPRLKRFELVRPIEEFIPYAPLFLSPKTTEIDIAFGEDSRMTGEASRAGVYHSQQLNRGPPHN